MQEKESGDAERQAVHQRHVFFYHDDIDKLFNIERDSEIRHGGNDEKNCAKIECLLVRLEKY